MREDVAAILKAVNAAQWELAQHMPQTEVAIFRGGFISALRAVAMAMHIHLEASELEPVALPHISVSDSPREAEPPRLLTAGQPLLVVGDPFWVQDDSMTDQP